MDPVRAMFENYLFKCGEVELHFMQMKYKLEEVNCISKLGTLCINFGDSQFFAGN